MQRMADEGDAGLTSFPDEASGDQPPHPSASSAHLLPRGEKAVAVFKR